MHYKRTVRIIAMLSAMLLALGIVAPKTAFADESATPDADAKTVKIQTNLISEGAGGVDQIVAGDNTEISDILNYEAPAGTVINIKSELYDTKDSKVHDTYEKTLLLVRGKAIDVTDKAQRDTDGVVTNIDELKQATPEDEIGSIVKGAYTVKMHVNTTPLVNYELKNNHEVLFTSDNIKPELSVGERKYNGCNDKEENHVFDSVFVISPKIAFDTNLEPGDGNVFKVHVKISGLKPNSPYSPIYCVGPNGHKDYDEHEDKPNTVTLCYHSNDLMSDANGMMEYDIVHKGAMTQDEKNNNVLRINLYYGFIPGPLYNASSYDPETDEEVIDVTSGITKGTFWKRDEHEFIIADIIPAVAADNAVPAETVQPTVSETADGLAPEFAGIIGIALASLIAASCIASRRRDKKA